jgi:Trypsin-like peptidase domain
VAGQNPGAAGPPQFQVSFVGTGFCILENRLIATAHHVLNNGQARNPADRFYVFAVPGNGLVAFPIPVTGYPLEDSNADMAILEVTQPAQANVRIPALSITLTRELDGQRVLTYGFPSPVIAAANVDNHGNWLGGNVFLKAHANEGIVSGQFEINQQLFYELNVGWYSGESGGPVVSLDPVAAFAMMQQYRNIQTPHGVVPGPHLARALILIEARLRELGARIV